MPRSEAGVMAARSPPRSETGAAGGRGQETEAEERPGDKSVKLDTLHSIR